MKVENLIHVFDREIEVLEIKEDCMVYAIDRKDDTKNRCVIERYTFEDKKITSLLSLDYTRLYEAFQTYGQNPAFFYAVNVLDDYRVRLRRIDKNSWEIKEDILLNAEGEVLSLYILDENHLLVTDEAEANESYLRDWGMSDGSRYMELCYIYDIKTGKKYPVMDCRFHNLLETVKTYPITDGSRTMFIPQSNEVLAVNTGAWIDAVKSQKPMPFETVFKAGQDETVAFVEDGALGFYGRVRGEGTEKIMFFGADGSCGPKCAYAYEAGGEYFIILPCLKHCFKRHWLLGFNRINPCARIHGKHLITLRYKHRPAAVSDWIGFYSFQKIVKTTIHDRIFFTGFNIIDIAQFPYLLPCDTFPVAVGLILPPLRQSRANDFHLKYKD